MRHARDALFVYINQIYIIIIPLAFYLLSAYIRSWDILCHSVKSLRSNKGIHSLVQCLTYILGFLEDCRYHIRNWGIFLFLSAIRKNILGIYLLLVQLFFQLLRIQYFDGYLLLIPHLSLQVLLLVL